jgi:hypothetical protein
MSPGSPAARPPHSAYPRPWIAPLLVLSLAGGPFSARADRADPRQSW